MENVNTVIQAVSTVGFPIVMCAALFWYMIQQNKLHKEETQGLQDAITELKIAITKLVEHFSNDKD